MFLRPTTPAVQSVFSTRHSKPRPHFVFSCPINTSSVPSSCTPSELFWYYNAVAHAYTCSQLIKPSSFSHALGRKAGRRFWRNGWKIKFEQQRYGRGLREDCSGATKKKGLKVRFDESLGGEGVDCYDNFNEGDWSMKTQQMSSGGNGLPDTVAMSSMEGKSLWSKLSQSVNMSGVLFSARVIVKDRHLAIPHVSVPDISWVDWKALRLRGFQGVLFDKDNTLTAPYGQNIWPPLKDSLEECREVFGGRIALLSNSTGLYQYDPLGAEAKALENRLGIPVIRHGQKKPAGNALAVSSYFGCDPSMLIMVGDRYFTDVVYGNSNGLLTIRPAPLTTLGEPFIVKRVRGVEETLVAWWRQQGCLPPKHKLFDNPVDFIKDPGCW